MFSARVLLLLACVALTAHAVDACVQLNKGDIQNDIHLTKVFKEWLPEETDKIDVDISETEPILLSIYALQVVVCNPEEPALVEVSYTKNTLHVKRIKRPYNPLEFYIVVYYSIGNESLEPATIGVTDGVQMYPLLL